MVTHISAKQSALRSGRDGPRPISFMYLVDFHLGPSLVLTYLFYYSSMNQRKRGK